MRKDDAHADNIWIMVRACQVTGTSFAGVSDAIGGPWVRAAADKLLAEQTYAGNSRDEMTDEIMFACGYLQATSNLTGESWADQLTRVDHETLGTPLPISNKESRT